MATARDLLTSGAIAYERGRISATHWSGERLARCLLEADAIRTRLRLHDYDFALSHRT